MKFKLQYALLLTSVIILNALCAFTHSTTLMFRAFNARNDTLISQLPLTQQSDPLFLATLADFANLRPDLYFGLWRQCQNFECFDLAIPGCGPDSDPFPVRGAPLPPSLANSRKAYSERLKTICPKFTVGRSANVAGSGFGLLLLLGVIAVYTMQSRVGAIVALVFLTITTVLAALSLGASTISFTLMKFDLDFLGLTAKTVNSGQSNTDSPYFNTFYQFSYGFFVVIAATAVSLVILIQLTTLIILTKKSMRAEFAATISNLTVADYKGSRSQTPENSMLKKSSSGPSMQTIDVPRTSDTISRPSTYYSGMPFIPVQDRNENMSSLYSINEQNQPSIRSSLSARPPSGDPVYPEGYIPDNETDELQLQLDQQVEYQFESDSNSDFISQWIRNLPIGKSDTNSDSPKGYIHKRGGSAVSSDLKL